MVLSSFLIATTAAVFLISPMSAVNPTFNDNAADIAANIRLGLNQVSSSFYVTVKKDHRDNLVCSPLSMAIVMGMIQSGAAGSTAEEIENALKVPSDKEELLKSLSALQDSIIETSGTKPSPVLLANNVYVQIGFNFKSDFKHSLQHYLKAIPEGLNFADSVSSAQRINSWVKENSKGKITKLFEEDSFSEDDRAVLVSVIHFKGEWAHKFPVERTEKESFFVTEINSIATDMMHLGGVRLNYGESPELDATILQLPFTAGNFSMIVVLPNKRTGLADLESKVSTSSLISVAQSLRLVKVDVTLPKFKIESHIDLKTVLSSMGISDLFDPESANLSGIFETVVPQLHVSKVIQKAVIEINEEGAEAAAATGAAIRTRRAAEFPEEFIADHPFIFAIVHSVSDMISETGSTVLFMGNVQNPSMSSSSPPKDEL